MQLAGLSYLSAPQVTGHPLGLPGAPDRKTSVTEVQPILDARRPETQLGRGSPRTFYYAVQNKPDPATHNPPPSIMQIKISQILQDQALGTKDAEPKPEPETGAQKTSDPAKEAREAKSGGEAQQNPQARTEPATGQTSTQTDAQAKQQEPAKAKPKAEPVPDRAPMMMPVKAELPADRKPKPTSTAPAAYEEAASISRKDVLSTLPGGKAKAET